MQPIDNAADGERRYNARLAVPHHLQIFSRWARESAVCRRTLRGHLDVRYGPSALETLDLFLPAGAARGTLMYVHGGYWRSLDKSDASLVAPAFVDAGYAVAVVNYSLCPAVKIARIVEQVAAAATWVQAHSPEWGVPQLFVAGHSAGAHLCAMLMTDAGGDHAPEIAGAVCVSGLYDLRPLLRVPSVVETTHLTDAESVDLSPVLQTHRARARLLTALGSNENEGFHEQTLSMRTRWNGAMSAHVDCAGHDHFSILDELFDANGSICRAALTFMDSPSAGARP